MKLLLMFVALLASVFAAPLMVFGSPIQVASETEQLAEVNQAEWRYFSPYSHVLQRLDEYGDLNGFKICVPEDYDFERERMAHPELSEAAIGTKNGLSERVILVLSGLCDLVAVPWYKIEDEETAKNVLQYLERERFHEIVLSR